jgi:LacI family transcriptional regulator, galactose operon repressor
MEGPGGQRVDAAPRPRATMRDVAALAGVSVKTVSRVVNGEPGVSTALLGQVERAVAQLDYRPNLSASSLRRADGKTAAIAAVLEDLANPFSAALLRGLEDEARQRRVLLFAGSVDEDPQREYDLVRAFTMRRADALVIAPIRDDQGYLYGDQRAGTPIVFVDRPPRGLRADAVLADNTDGARLAVRHLAAHGHRRIAYLGDLLDIATAAERHQGYREACLDLGIRTPPHHTVHDLRSVDAAATAVTGLMTGDDPPTALFTSQNLVTIGAVRALQHLGLHDRVAVVGFDDFPAADLLQPRVTVIAQDPAGMGRTAASLVFRRLDGEQWPPARHIVPVTLIERGSGEIRPTGSG